MNLPNILTLMRIILVVPFVALIMMGQNIPAFVIFVIAAITDFLDGYIARKYNLITDFGKLMDPLADKILVMSALILFVEVRYIPAWVVIIILFREFLVTGIRTIAASKGVVIPAENSGKYKTVTQILAIMLILFTGQSIISLFIIIVPLIFTIWSGIEVVLKARKFL